MATRAGLTTYPFEGGVQVQWSGLLNTDDGQAASIAQWPTKSVQATGTLGVGGITVMEGSNDGVTWGPLRDSTGTAISLSAIGTIIRDVLENTRYIRPRVSAGDGSTNFTITLIGI